MASDDEHSPGFEPGRGYTQEDWDEVCDNPPITPEQTAQSRPLAEAMPELVAAMKRGRDNPRTPTKDLVTLRLDKDVLAAFRASGSGWQSRANAMLRKGLGLDLSQLETPPQTNNVNPTIISVVSGNSTVIRRSIYARHTQRSRSSYSVGVR